MKTKIVVVGVGGVGGYYGGLLARKYERSEAVEICFLARGNHLEKIKKAGLIVESENENETFVARPALASEDVNEIGKADYIIISTKSYDLAETVEQIKPMIKENTVILPLLNGISITSEIRSLLPGTEVWYGCVYIVGRKTADGAVASMGGVHDFFFGSEKRISKRMQDFEKLLIEAGIKARISSDILSRVWDKYFFISSTATLTSYYDVGFGALLTDDERYKTLNELLKELYKVSQAEKINLNESIIEKIIAHIRRLPFDTTASMHSDVKSGKGKTEIETLTHTVIELAEKHRLDVPYYKKIYSELKERLGNG
jgi:2-dehydropantoate 2-reductase